MGVLDPSAQLVVAGKVLIDVPEVGDSIATATLVAVAAGAAVLSV